MQGPPDESSLVYTETDGVPSVTDSAGTPVALRPQAIEAAVARWRAWRASPERERAELVALGNDLGHALVPHAAHRAALQRAIGVARGRGSPFRLFVEGSGEFLARVPWEALRLCATSPLDPVDGILASQPDVSLMRRSRDAAPPIVGDRDEARILIVTADPGSWRYPRLAWLATEAQAIGGRVRPRPWASPLEREDAVRRVARGVAACHRRVPAPRLPLLGPRGGRAMWNEPRPPGRPLGHGLPRGRRDGRRVAGRRRMPARRPLGLRDGRRLRLRRGDP